MLNATVYEYAILASVLVTLMGGIAYTTPPYNPALALFGIYVYNAQNPRITGWFLVLLPVSIIFDICYCGVWGPGISDVNKYKTTEIGSTEQFGLAMTIINMFIKLGQTALTYMEFTRQGGLTAASHPDTHGANAGAYADFDDKAHQEAAVPSSYQDSVAAGGYQQPGFQAP